MKLCYNKKTLETKKYKIIKGLINIVYIPFSCLLLPFVIAGEGAYIALSFVSTTLSYIKWRTLYYLKTEGVTRIIDND